MMSEGQRSPREWIIYRDRLSAALKAARICIFEVDLEKQLYTFMENAEAIFGKSSEAIMKDVRAFSRLSNEEYRAAASYYFVHPDYHQAVSEAFQSIFAGRPTSYEARMRAGDTDYVWCKVDVTPVLEGGFPSRMIGVITDINDLKLQADSYKEALSVDMLTGLLNKVSAEARIKDILRKNGGGDYALLLMDLDDFKSINDRYGHQAGDAVLIQAAEELKERFGEKDIIGRWGGDEFIVFVRLGNAGAALLEEWMDKLIAGALCHGATKSVGAALYPGHAKDFDRLFAMADTALYKAKEEKGTFRIFDGDMGRGHLK